MRKVVLTGGSKGLGKAIKDEIGKWHAVPGCAFSIQEQIPPLYEVIDFSRTTGYDLDTTDGTYKAINKLVEINPDILILNAGKWENSWGVNYHAPKALAEKMPKGRLVVFILSNAAYQSYGNDDYTAAKSGILHYVRRKQREGYAFSSISPGTINTDFWAGAEVDNRKKGAMKPEVVAESVYHIIQQAEKGVLIREMIIMPEIKNANRT